MPTLPPTIPITSEQVVTLIVDVVGTTTVRTYTDGAVQRNAWETAEEAQAYAQSVATQEGLV